MANATNDDCRCSFMVPRKKRRCRMTVKAGNLYCGEHIHLLAKDSNEDQPQSDDVNRIPCPLDSKHSCSATKLKSHLLKCPSKAQASVEYISCSVNVPDRSKGITAAAGLTVASASDDQLMDVISKVNAIYVKEVEKCISSEILNHPLIDEEINLPHVGPAASKHLVQNSSLLAHLNANGALTRQNANVIEFGSGRGQMSYWIAKASSPEAQQRFLLVDKASQRHKFDNRLKDDPLINISRIRADIQDLVLERIPDIKNDTKSPVIGVSKHLCGAATDLALRCMDTFTSSTKDRLELILIALCCHHRCDWNVYVGKDYLLEHGFTAEEFSLLCGLSSWATCGTGLPRNPKPKEDLKSEEENVHVDRYDRLKLPRIEREEIGRRCKRVIDMGRCHYVRDKIGLPNTRLAFYVDLSYTLENVFLLAKN